MHRREWMIAVFLVGFTLALYWPVRQFDLVYFDDPIMLTECPPVQAGLTWGSVKWSFTEVVAANWNPVTCLSYLAVSEFFGIAPGPHHLANAILHALNAGLLFLVLRRLTGATWRSAVVAAIFAWHPQRVESVAWIIERKDVLCGFFFFLTLLAYARYVEASRQQPERQGIKAILHPPSSIGCYVLSLVFFVLALLSKPMAVTLPFVLLLLDVWPLKRFPISDFRFPIFKQLVLEKWPFFLLMLVGCVATYWLQRNGAATTSWEVLGWEPRVANAIAGYVAYLGQLFWPVDFAVIYPYPKSFDPVQTGLKFILLLAITIGCLSQFKRRPQLAVGWFWYLGMAVPVIGIIQVGEQAMADRYTYLPLIGPVVALVWTAGELFSKGRNGKVILISLALVMLSALTVLTVRQLQHWRNTITLFEHNVAVTPENGSAYFTLGLGFEHAGDTNRAITCYRSAKELSPADPQPRRNLANLLMKQGLLAAAESEWWELIVQRPTDFSARLGLEGVLQAQGREAEAISQLNEAVRLSPDSADALNNLAWLLATSPHAELRDGLRAVILARRACELTKFSKTIFIGTLGAAYAEAGQFDEAVLTAQKACEIAAKNGETGLLRRNQQLLDRYRSHQTAREQ